MTVNYDELFRLGMWWRIFYGVMRIMVGLAVLKVVGKSLGDVFTSLMGYELIEDPQDVLYTFIHHVLDLHPVHISYFVAFYFIFWGILDVVLSYNLLKHRLWAFPASIVLISSFVFYEIIRFFIHTHSPVLLVVISIDFFILWIIKREYKKLESQLVTR